MSLKTKSSLVLTDLTLNTRLAPSINNRQVIYGGSLKTPVDTLDELNVIERDNEKFGTLVFYFVSLFFS